MNSNSAEQTSITFVSDKNEFKTFLNYPYKLYKGDPHWIAPLKLQQKELLDLKKNPFFRDADIAMFIAERNGVTAGRLAAIHNKGYNRFNETNCGFFGFFECIDHQPTASLLFRVANDWLRNKGLDIVYGPFSPNMMAEIGTLVEGFDVDPGFMMPYNRPYYNDLIINSGFEKHIDLLAFRVDEKDLDMERVMKAEDIVKRRLPDLTIRKVNLKNFKQELVTIRDIFNKAWARNWGFSPLTEEEFQYLVQDLKLIIDPDLALVAEINGSPIAFTVSLPDLNVALKKLDGTLFPTGLFKLLYHKNKIRQVRTALMGVLPEWQGKGIDAVMHQKTIINGTAKGYHTSELSWLLETNINMINVALRLGAREEKRYRIYKKQLLAAK